MTRRWHKGKKLWVIFVYSWYGVATELINSYYNEVYRTSSYFNFNLFNIVEYCLLTYFIYTLIASKALRIIIFALSFAFLVLATIHLCRPFFYTHYDSVANVLECILLIIYAIFYFFEQIKQPSHIFFYAIPEFWIIVAILLYFSGTFFIVLYAQSQLENKAFLRQYQVINNAFDVLKNLLLGLAMLMHNVDKSNNISRNRLGSLDEHLNLNR